MTLAGQFDFGRSRQLAQTASELDIPDHPSDAGECQGYAVQKGDRFEICSADFKREGHYRVDCWIDAVKGEPRRVRLENIHSGSPLYLSGWQFSFLETTRRIRAVSMRSISVRAPDVVPGLLLMNDCKRLVRAEKLLGYATAVLAQVTVDGVGRFPKAQIVSAIKAHAVTLGEEPPEYRTVQKAIVKYLDRLTDDPLRAVAERPRPGNTVPAFTHEIEQAMAEAAVHAWRTPKGTWKTARKEFERLVGAMRGEGRLPPADSPKDVALPSDTTIYRRMYAVNRYDRCRLRFGEEEADRRFARYIRQSLPDCVLDIVDVDHTTLNVTVIDDRFPIAYGRPDLIVFRDRKAGAVLGYSVGFDNPSYESFLHGFRHAAYPKDMSAFPGLGWSQYGVGVRYGVDNALHLIGDNIREASQQLRFQLVEYRPGRPWEKGALERLFGILNAELIENLPGATTSSAAERKQYDEEKEKARPKLLLSELDAFLTWYFAHEHNARPHEGLGFLRTLKGVPNQIWQADIGKVKQRHPIDPSIFVRLAGDVDHRTIGPLGVRWDHITYQSAELLAVDAHPKHRRGKGEHRGTKYRVVRDPNDLGRIWLEDPYAKRVIEVPACSADYSYANGLRLFQHRKIVEYWNTTHDREPESGEELLQCMEAYESALAEFHRDRRKHGTALKLARFFSKQAKRLQRGRVIEAVPVAPGSGRMDLRNPDGEAPMLPRSERAQRTVPGPESGEAYTVIEAMLPTRAEQSGLPGPRPLPQPVEDDIETLKSRYKGY
jgi:putative transposase